MADGPLPPPEVRTITIPGVNDVLALPSIEDPHIKRERLTRWSLNANRTTIPEPLRWLPQLINWTDDAQDILITALILGKPLLRRLPLRFLPYLGWALLANDVLNLFTGMLSAPLNPRSLKADFLKTTRRATAGRTAGVRAAEAFLLPGRVRFIPFALTAGQVLYSFTGWGLRLGALMGAVSEGWWGIIQKLRGARVEIHGPPPSDPATKAARYLSQAFNWNALAAIANPIEIALHVAATNAALGILGAPAPITMDDGRLQEYADLTCPLFAPWHPVTQQVLAESNLEPLSRQRCATPTLDPFPSYSLATRATLADNPGVDVDLARESHDAWTDWPVGMMATEAAQVTWDAFGAGVDMVVPLNSPMERMLGIALEHGLLPPFYALPWDPVITQTSRTNQFTMQDGFQNPYDDTTGKMLTHGWHLPIAYPPPDENPHVQIAHWCAVALAIHCRKQILLPHYNNQYLHNRVTIDRWYPRGREGMNPMWVASQLVWGNYWVRRYGPPPRDPGKTKTKFNYCTKNSTGWIGLSGVQPEWDAFQQVLDRLPPIGTPPVPTGTDNTTPAKWQSRLWLDSYLRAQDRRRQSGPPFPNVDELDPPIVPRQSDFWTDFLSLFGAK